MLVKQSKMNRKNKKVYFLALGKLHASLVENPLTCKGLIRADEEKNRFLMSRHTLTNFEIFSE